MGSPLVTDKLVEQIEAIRKTGKYNMFEIYRIQREADQRGYHELVIFLEEHREAYSRYIISNDRG